MKERKHITSVTKSNIIEAYLVVSKEKKGTRVTAQNVVDQSGYNRTTLYRHFRSMQLLREAADVWLGVEPFDVSRKIRYEIKSGDTKSVAQGIIWFITLYRSRILLLRDIEEEAKFKQEFIKIVMQSYFRANKRIAKKQEDYYRLLTHYHVSGTVNLCIEYVRNPGNVSIETIGDLFAQLHFKGVTALIKELEEQGKKTITAKS